MFQKICYILFTYHFYFVYSQCKKSDRELKTFIEYISVKSQ